MYQTDYCTTETLLLGAIRSHICVRTLIYAYRASVIFEELHGGGTSICLCLTGVQSTVDKVPCFLSNRPNWLPPPSHPQESVARPLWLQGGDTHGERGRGEPIRTKGQTLWYSRYTVIKSPKRCVHFCDSYPIDVSHVSFKVLCLLLL